MRNQTDESRSAEGLTRDAGARARSDDEWIYRAGFERGYRQAIWQITGRMGLEFEFRWMQHGQDGSEVSAPASEKRTLRAVVEENGGKADRSGESEPETGGKRG